MLFRLLYKGIAVLLLIAALAGGLLWLVSDSMLKRPLDLPEAGLVVTIEPGTHLSELVGRLHSEGVIQDPPLLVSLWARRAGYARRIQSGEFLIEPGSRLPELMQTLSEGAALQYSLTLIEGWNIRQVRAAIEAEETLVQTLNGIPDDALMAALDLPPGHPEGQFLPDTYRFPRGTSDADFLRRAYHSMQATLAQVWQERAAQLPLKSPYEALILASIIEKETGQASERTEIAGVFVRRLRKNMKLQTDPTVIYGIGERFNGNITRKDLRTDTPYNTYVHRGLPPTPIAMPGRDAIEAAVNPAAGKSLFFVSRGDGTHQFSETLKQHNQAVRKYVLKK